MDGEGLITVELSADFFNCPMCLQPYLLPIFQCNAGHSLCSACRKISGKDCPTCEKATVYKHNKALESVVTQALFRCVNRKYGCRKLSSCCEKAIHESECLYVPIFCPETNCNFRGSTQKLPGHLAVKHGHSIEKFHYDRTFTIHISDGSKMEPLVAEDGTVFLLQSRKEVFGQVISVVCIRSPGLKEPDFMCNLKIGKSTNGTRECDLVLRCPVPSTTLEDGVKPSKYFLLLPADCVSEHFGWIEVEICIKIEAEGLTPATSKKIEVEEPSQKRMKIADITL